MDIIQGDKKLKKEEISQIQKWDNQSKSFPLLNPVKNVKIMEIIKRLDANELKQNKLIFMDSKLFEFHTYFAWLNSEFEKLGIRCEVMPAKMSWFIKEYSDKLREEMAKTKSQSINWKNSFIKFERA